MVGSPGWLGPGPTSAGSSLLCVLPGGAGGDRVGSDMGSVGVGPGSFSG